MQQVAARLVVTGEPGLQDRGIDGGRRGVEGPVEIEADDAGQEWIIQA